MTTLDDIDTRLAACYQAYVDAMDTGDLQTADAMFTTIDELLDQRTHTAQGQG